jgi:hypothetical protein
MFDVVAQFCQAVVLSVLILFLRREEMLLGEVSCWTNHFLKVNQTQSAIVVGIKSVNKHIGISLGNDFTVITEKLN